MNSITETTIRRAIPADVEELIELLRQLFSLEIDFEFHAQHQKKGLSLMLDDPQTRCVMVAELGQTIVGMCTAQLVVSTAQGGFSGLIEDMVVHQDHRGIGLGSCLLEAVELWCIESGASRIQLLADKTNLRALNFYNHRHWKCTQLICLRKSETYR
jgi:GNAT superfamily N-acetyltransferase